MKIQAIIPTAGIGARFRADFSKPLAELRGKPICVHTLEAFEKSPAVDSVILVGQKERLSQLEGFVGQYGLQKVTQVIAGGETRRESVSIGLSVLDNDTDIVLVHDGVRPLVSLKMIEDAVALCGKWEAGTAAVPIKPTIKKVNKKSLFVEETLNREELWEVQTPQVFRKDILLKAHKQNADSHSTDDAAMVEQLGVKVKVFPGDYRNIKITTQEDLLIAEVFLRSEGSPEVLL